MDTEFLFMDDNACLHRANIVDECLQSEDITRIYWSAYSPDLNPIEHVGDMLGPRIAARQPPSTCLPELRRALLDERGLSSIWGRGRNLQVPNPVNKGVGIMCHNSIRGQKLPNNQSGVMPGIIGEKIPESCLVYSGRTRRIRCRTRFRTSA
ncbi:transposable element Tcb1 transposase [Trichonephila clavipes]|nr:transposable element Tcb1 transposase [Trichonephila clavipes]